MLIAAPLIISEKVGITHILTNERVNKHLHNGRSHGSQNKGITAIHTKEPELSPMILSPGEGNGNPLQYSCLENSMDRGAWQATVYGFAKSWT